MQFSMPNDSDAGPEGNQPAIWALNSQIDRTLQYGNPLCSCWDTGCGELDIVEALSPGSTFLKSTLHDTASGGDSDYIARPTTKTMKLAVIFHSATSSIHIQVLPNNMDFAASIDASEIEDLCLAGKTNSVSDFTVS